MAEFKQLKLDGEEITISEEHLEQEYTTIRWEAFKLKFPDDMLATVRKKKADEKLTWIMQRIRVTDKIKNGLFDKAVQVFYTYFS